MSKKLSLLLVLLLAIGMMAACGGAATEEAPAEQPAAEEPAAEEPAAEEPAAEEPAAEEPAAEAMDDVIKVGQVTDVGGVNDKSFNQLAWEGMQNAELDFGVEINVLESQQQTDYDKNINEFIQQGYDLIVTVGFLLGDATLAAAEANPDSRFAIIDVAYLPPLPNLVQSTFAVDEAAVLVGYLSAGVSETGKVGTFGGINIPPVVQFMVGFETGVNLYNEVHGTSVEVLGWSTEAGDGLFTGNFDSLDDGRTFAENLFDEGADIIMPVAGPVGAGSAAAAQERGLMMIGVDQDWYYSAPEFKEVYLTSLLKQVDLVGYNSTEAVINGTFEGGVMTLNLANDGVGLSEYHDQAGKVSAELQAELDQLKQDIIDGKVSTGWAEYISAPPAEEEAPAEEMGYVWPEAPATEGNFVGVDPTGQTVLWWNQHDGSRAEKLDAIIAKFEAENPYGITIDSQYQGGYNDIREKMGAGAVSGDLPDLVVGYQNDQAFYASVDLLTDMDNYVKDAYWGLSDEEVADFSPGIFTQDIHPAFDNKRLGFPPNRSMEVIRYNKTWVEELGFDVAEMDTISPELFEEIACAAAADRGDGEGGYLIRFDASQVAAAAMARGADVLGEDGQSYVYNSPELVEYFTQVKRMYDNGCAWISPERYHDAEFAARQTIFYLGSTSGLPYTQEAFDEVSSTDEWDIAPIAYTTDEPRLNMYGASVLMPYSTPEKELAAWIFVKWFTSPEAQADWARASNYFSPRYGAADYLGDYMSENPKYAKAMELLPYSSFEPQLISYTEVRNAVNDAFQEIINTDVDIQEALDELTDLANELHAEAIE